MISSFQFTQPICKGIRRREANTAKEICISYTAAKMYAGLQSGNLQHGFFFLPHSPFFFFLTVFFFPLMIITPASLQSCMGKCCHPVAFSVPAGLGAVGVRRAGPLSAQSREGQQRGFSSWSLKTVSGSERRGASRFSQIKDTVSPSILQSTLIIH